MLVESIPAELLATNCWVVGPAAGEECVVIDPGGGLGDRLARFLDEHRLTPVAVLLTHGHFDHTMSAADVAHEYGVAASLHAADRWQLADPWSGVGLPSGARVPGLPDLTPRVPDEVRELHGGEALELAGMRIDVISVPGHTPGSVIYAVESDGTQTMFTGDFLFAGSIGRMDLPGGSEPEMAASLRHVFATAPDAAVVNPGHGPASSIGRERRTNPFLQEI